MPASMLVVGGARSGKSRFAQEWAEAAAPHRVCIATARVDPDDGEMAARIARHRADREARGGWTTIEAGADLPTAVARAAASGAGAAVIDCATLWLCALGELHAWHEEAVLTAVDDLAGVLAAPPLPVAVVSNEVGSGIVPDHALARSFRDLQGWTNQRLAAACASVALVACGLPLWLKRGGG